MIRDYKKSRGCKHCGETHTFCLVFHHRDPQTKRFTIQRAIATKISVADLEVEMGKCDVVCLNCHAKIHAPI